MKTIAVKYALGAAVLTVVLQASSPAHAFWGLIGQAVIALHQDIEQALNFSLPTSISAGPKRSSQNADASDLPPSQTIACGID